MAGAGTTVSTLPATLRARGTQANQVGVPSARELAAFMGASAQQVPVPPSIPHTYGVVERPSSFAVHRRRPRPGVVSSSTA